MKIILLFWGTVGERYADHVGPSGHFKEAGLYQRELLGATAGFTQQSA